LRGYRIELGEVEAVLVQHPAVRDAVAVVRDEGSERRLVAYAALQPRAEATPAALRTHLQQHVPGYMVPAAIVMLDTIPLSPNGKVDRSALPAPDDRLSSSGSRRVPPLTDLERQLVEIWESLLGTGPIGVRDNFFDLGGHSLLAVRLVSLVERQLQRTLHVADVFQAPTIEQLAAVMAEQNTGAVDPIVVFRREGANAPLFFMPLIDGYAFYLRTLVEHLDEERPIYSLQPSALDGRTEPWTTIESIASAMVDEIVQVQPRGPYYVCGYCFGGYLAYEVACQLAERGESIGLVALIDTILPSATFERWIGRRLWGHAMRLWRLPWPEKGTYFRDRVRGLWQRIQGNVTDNMPVDDSDTPTARAIVRIREASEQAIEIYRPRPFGSRLVLLRADREEDRDFFWFEPLDGWNPLARGEIDIYDLVCGHNEIFQQPHVKTLAEHLNRYLTEVSGEGRSAKPPAAAPPCPVSSSQ
jgi:thioesterase domain-containing protein